MKKKPTKYPESPDDMVTVQLDVTAQGFINTKMTRAKFDEIFCNGANVVDLDEVLTDWSTVVDDLTFEVSDAAIVRPIPVPKRASSFR